MRKQKRKKYGVKKAKENEEKNGNRGGKSKSE